MTKTRLPSDKRADPKATTNAPRPIGDGRLETVSGGAARKIIIVGG